jgi:hypothetical protein
MLNGRGVSGAKARLGCLVSFLLISWLAFAQGTSPVPWIANPLVPGVVPPGSSAFTLTVNGTGFVSGSTVYWNGSSRATTVVNASQLMAAISASDVATAASGAVTVHNPGGTVSNVALLLVTNPVSAPSFGASGIPQLESEGTLYYGMLAGDFDGDGFEDVIVNQGLVLEVIRGLGNGSFQYPVDYTIPASTEAYGEIMADFNNDGRLDVALSNYSKGVINVFLANPDGTLQTPLQDPLGSGYNYSAAADFNGDGKLDMVVGVPPGVKILLGNGDGTFKTPISVPLVNSATSVAVGDFNRDGIPDIAAGNFVSGGGQDPYVSILLGKGDGTFAPHVDYTVGRAPEDMTVADFNGDGYPDIVVIDGAVDYPTFYVLLNNGDGTFAPAVANVGTLGIPYDTVTSGDFNGDGKIDLAFFTSDYCLNDCLQIFLGNGDGTFQPPLRYGAQLNYSGGFVGTLTVGDFNRDGMLDIASPTGQGPFVFIQTPGPSPTIEEGSLNFGSEAVGSQTQAIGLALYDPGSYIITVNTASTTGDFQVPSNVQCVMGGSEEECGISVWFTPTEAGTRTGTLQINSSGGTQYVSLVGTGTAGTAAVTLNPASLTFTEQTLKTISAYQIVNIENTGTGTLYLTGMSLTGANASDFVLINEDCQSSVAPGASCFVGIEFQPSLRGPRSASLSIADNAANSPQMVPLSGTGTTNSFSPSSLKFGTVTVGSSETLTLTLTNVGGLPTSIEHVGFAGSDSSDYTQTNSCGSTLAAKASCTFNVTFTPSASGWRKGELTVASNATGTVATANSPVSGIGK